MFSSNSWSVAPWLNTPGICGSRPTYQSPSSNTRDGIEWPATEEIWWKRREYPCEFSYRSRHANFVRWRCLKLPSTATGRRSPQVRRGPALRFLSITGSSVNNRNRQTSFDGFPQIGTKLLHRLALCGATGDGGNFGP